MLYFCKSLSDIYKRQMKAIVQIISKILNLVSPIVNIIGTIAFVFMLANGVLEILCPMGVLAIIGIVYGILAFKSEIRPRMFWFDKVNRIYSTPFTIILSYGIIFALWIPFLKLFTLPF